MRFSFRVRLMAMVVGPMLLAAIFLTVFSGLKLNELGNMGAESELTSFCKGTVERYNALNDEDFTFSNGMLKKGDVEDIRELCYD